MQFFMWRPLPVITAAGLCYLQGAVATDSEQAPQGGQAAVALFRRRAEQYERDAEEAEAAAQHYANLAQKAVAESSATVAGRTMKKLQDAGVNAWARAALHVERMMDDPRPGVAANAGLKARGIYDKRFNQYLKAGAQYGDAARGYNLRAGMDKTQAKQLRAYGEQLKLEGDGESAKTYDKQAELLDEQADKLKKVSENYAGMSGRIATASEQIEAMAAKAEKFAQWQANPAGVPGDGDLWTYTIAPPIQYAPTTVAPMPPGMMAGPGVPPVAR